MADWRSPARTHPSSCTRTQSPDRPSTRAGAPGCRRAECGRLGRGEERCLPGRLGPIGIGAAWLVAGRGRRSRGCLCLRGVGLASRRGRAPDSIGATASRGTQPARLTWVQPPRVSSLRSRAPARARPTTLAVGRLPDVLPVRRVTTRSNPSRRVGCSRLAEDPPLNHHLLPGTLSSPCLDRCAGRKRDQGDARPAPFGAG